MIRDLAGKALIFTPGSNTHCHTSCSLDLKGFGYVWLILPSKTFGSTRFFQWLVWHDALLAGMMGGSRQGLKPAAQLTKLSLSLLCDGQCQEVSMAVNREVCCFSLASKSSQCRSAPGHPKGFETRLSQGPHQSSLISPRLPPVAG